MANIILLDHDSDQCEDKIERGEEPRISLATSNRNERPDVDWWEDFESM